MTDKLPPRSSSRGGRRTAYVDAKRVPAPVLEEHATRSRAIRYCRRQVLRLLRRDRSLWVYYGVLDRNLGATETKTAKERFS